MIVNYSISLFLLWSFLTGKRLAVTFNNAFIWVLGNLANLWVHNVLFCILNHRIILNWAIFIWIGLFFNWWAYARVKTNLDKALLRLIMALANRRLLLSADLSRSGILRGQRTSLLVLLLCLNLLDHVLAFSCIFILICRIVASLPLGLLRGTLRWSWLLLWCLGGGDVACWLLRRPIGIGVGVSLAVNLDFKIFSFLNMALAKVLFFFRSGNKRMVNMGCYLRELVEPRPKPPNV